MSARFRPFYVVALVAALGSRALAQPLVQIACGETFQRTLGVVPDELLVLALPGEVLSITVAPDPRTHGFLPRWRLIDVLGRGVLLSNGTRRCTGRCETTPLPLSGVFTLRITDPGQGEGLYGVSVEAVSATANGVSNGPPTPTCARLLGDAPDGTRPIGPGDTLAGTIAVAGETDTFTFVASPGDVVSADLQVEGGLGAFAPRWVAFDATGTRLAFASGVTACAGACETAVLTIGGVATVLVFEDGNNATGAYTLSVGSAPPTTTSTSTTSTTTLDGGTTTTTLDGSTTTTTATSPTTTTVDGTSTTTTTLLPPYELDRTILGPVPPGVPAPRLGSSLAATTGRLLVGVPHAEVTVDEVVTLDAGTVFVLDVAGMPEDLGFGLLRQAAIEPGAAEGHRFGAAVAAIDGGMLVGAPGAGAAYHFPSTDFPDATALHPPDAEAGGEFGAAVAASDTRLAVGAPVTGRVYLFDRTMGAPAGVLDPPSDTLPQDAFGAALAAEGDRIAVGAPGTTTRPGRVHVFDAPSGALLVSFEGDLPQAGDEFGAALVFVEGDLVVGAPGRGTAGRFDGQSGDFVNGYEHPGTAGDRFGAVLATDGATLYVGAPADAAGGVPGGGAVYRFDVASGALADVQRKSPAVPEDAYGTSLAATDDRVFVGIPGDDSGTTDGGAVHLHEDGLLAASFRQRLTMVGFGSAVASGPDVFVVGAPIAAGGRGAAALVDPATSAIREVLENPTDHAARFGATVGTLGAEIVIGAPLELGAEGDHVGTVYVYDGAVLDRTLPNPRPRAGDQFGFALDALEGDLLVGAPQAGELDTGAVYRIDGADGALRVTYGKPAPSTGDFFGAAVDGEGTQVLVGAPLDASSGAQAGAVYLFNADTAALVASVPNPTGAEDLFGAAVALGQWIVVGAPLADGGAGRVYQVERATGAVVRTLTGPNSALGDHFGAALAVAGSVVLVGAPFDDDGAIDTGSVHAFDLVTGALAQTIRNPPQAPFDHFGFALATGPEGLLVGSPGPSRIYVFDTPSVGGAVTARLMARGSAPVAECRNGLVEGGEECDDGNTIDSDDCRNDCTRGPCCTIDPLVTSRCDDGDRCTQDAEDPQGGCLYLPSGAPGCCRTDADCPGGQCRVCVGCFLFKWDCCDTGSMCVPSNPLCADKTCLEAAYCQCGGKLDCGTEPIPVGVQTLFASACDFLRLQVSVAPDGTPTTQPEIVLARARARTSRKTLRMASRSARELVKSGGLSRSCRKRMLGQMKVVKRTIPRGKKLRRCAKSGG